MSEVKRWYIGVYGGEAQARVCAPHPHEFIRDTEGEIFVLAEQFDACEARNRALQQRLTAADEREDALERLLRQFQEVAHGGFLDDDHVRRVRRDIDAAIESAYGSKPTICTWSEGGLSWHTDCGKEWQFTDGGLPAENGMHFCHSCGKKLVVEQVEGGGDD